MIAGRLFVVVAALAPACNHVSGDDVATPARIELRDVRGQPRQSLYPTADDGFRWLDAREGTGRILRQPGGRRAQDGAGTVLESAGVAAGSLELRRPDGKSLRLSREPTGFRLGDGAGIPIARTRIDAAETLVHDAGGLVVLRARREGGRIVVTDREGAAVGFVVGDALPEIAALVWLPALGAAERALLLTAVR